MVTDRLVDHCLNVESDRPDLPRHLLDWVAVAVGGAGYADSSPAILDGVRRIAGPSVGAGGVADEGADRDSDTGRRRSSAAATILPGGERVAPADAALANGALAHSLDFDDTHLASSVHPGAPTIAAALAAAEAADASAERFRAGIAAGYDVTCAVGEAVGPDAHYDRGFHVTATCGTFGATAAAGVVRGLDREALTNAFGIAGSQAAGSLQFLANGAWNKRLHPGLAARRGIEATDLAAAGVVGAAEPIAGEHGFLAAYTDDPHPEAVRGIGERDAVAETGLKPYPCCRYLHPAIDGLRSIVAESAGGPPETAAESESPGAATETGAESESAAGIDPSRVESVRIALPSAGVRLTGEPIEAKRRPDGFVDCQFSAPFAAAVTLTAGDAGAEPFLRAVGRLGDAPLWDDPGFERLMDATTVTTDEAVEARFPEEWAARVSVTVDGTTRERVVETPRGEPERQLSDAACRAKARGLCASSDVDADRLARVVDGVGSGDGSYAVRDLVDAATEPGV